MMKIAIFCAVLLCVQGLAFGEPIAKKAISEEAAAFAAASVASRNTTLVSTRASLTCSSQWKCGSSRGYE
jgi:hypothetical protein